MLIRYSDGRVEPATLIGASDNAVRVAFPRGHASAEFTRSNGEWSSDGEGCRTENVADERWLTKPLAIQLYERCVRGESVGQLAAALGTPVERVAARIRAAESYIRQISDTHQGAAVLHVAHGPAAVALHSKIQAG